MNTAICGLKHKIVGGMEERETVKSRQNKIKTCFGGSQICRLWTGGHL